MKDLLINIRFYILCFSVLLSLLVYFQTTATIEGIQATVKLTEYYALLAIGFLYVTLLASPLTRFFPFLPFRGKYLKARRALGVSTFYFAFLHANFAFFGQLGGFSGLSFLTTSYLIPISLGFTALIIFAVMAATANETMVDRLTFPRWKFLHRFVYLAGILVMIHALMLGSHFAILSDTIPQILFWPISFLLILESARLDNWWQGRFLGLPKIPFISVLVAGFLAYAYFTYINPINTTTSALGVHSQHIQLAREAQQGQFSNSVANIPGLKGDKTKRYTASFLHDSKIQSNKPTQLTFQIYDASSGNLNLLFDQIYEKRMHLIIVDSSLKSFDHVHPDLTEQGFKITYTFPKDGVYHLYIDYQPTGAIEQQMAFTLTVGKGQIEQATTRPDSGNTKIFDTYAVSIDPLDGYNASQMSIGTQTMKFTIKDKEGNPITNLKPYLASFGHLVMINEQTYDYLHVHPTNTVAPKPEDTGGPTVEFMPLGLYGPIKPGIYRVFAQFNPNEKLMVADFTIEVN